jgi:predicted nucleotidyltransferase
MSRQPADCLETASMLLFHACRISYCIALAASFLDEKPSMLTKESIIRVLRENYPYLAAEYGVKRIGLFGSYARDVPTESSDIDLVVEFEHPLGFKFIELSDYLEQLLGEKVDILTPAGIQGIRISQIAQNIGESIVYVQAR